MESLQRLKISTNNKANGEEKSEEDLQPVSPTGQYFNSSVLSISILAILESQIPIDDSPTMALLTDVFLPINPRFSSIMVVDKQGVKQWKRVKVNLQDHINIPTFPSGLSPEDYDEHFDNYLTKIAMNPLPQNRPLWELHIVKYPTSKSSGNIIFKLHHALGDGFSLMGALLSCMERADDPSFPLTFPSFRSSLKVGNYSQSNAVKYLQRTVSAVYNTACDFGWSVLKSSVIEDDKTAIRSGGEAVEFNPVKISTVAFSLDLIKQVKVKLEVTINDVISGTIIFGTQLYMQGDDTKLKQSKSTALVLLNTRNIDGYKSIDEMVKVESKAPWGNRFAFIHLSLPKITPDKSLNPLEFVYNTHKNIQRKRSSLGVYLTGQLLETMRKYRGPEAAAEYMHSTLKKSSMTISNMIGPVEQMALANHPCKGIYFMVVGVPQSLTITVLSYMRTLRIAIGAEKGYIDLPKFNSCIENAFELIYQAAMKSG